MHRLADTAVMMARLLGEIAPTTHRSLDAGDWQPAQKGMAANLIAPP
jgi:hypothetical protein